MRNLKSLRVALLGLVPAVPAFAQVVIMSPPQATAPLAVTNGRIGISGVTSAQGNGAKVQLSTGTTTTDNCVKFDANGNTVDAGAACGSGGGGSVSVTAGTPDVVVTPSPGTGTFTVGTTAAATAQSGQTYTVLSTDANQILNRTYAVGAMADTFPNVSTPGFGAGAQYAICAQTKDDVISVTSPSTINGVSTYTIPAKSCVSIADPDGANYVALGLPPDAVGITKVQSGTADQLLYDNAGVLGEVSKVNNGVLVTNGSGTPSISTTLPTGLALSTPASGSLVNATNLPLTTGVTGSLPVANGGTACVAAGITCFNNITGATGVQDSTTYYRGDNTFVAVSGGSGAGGGMSRYSITTATLTSGTWYAPMGGAQAPTATEAAVNAGSPAATTVDNIRVLLDTNAPTGGVVVTGRKAGSDQALTCTVAAGTKTCTATGSFNVAATDATNWKIVVTNTYTGSIEIYASDGTSAVGVTSITAGTGLSGGTIATSGTINCNQGSSSTFGCIKVDNTTTTASAGVITAANTTIGGAACTPGGSCAPRTVVGGVAMVGTAQNNTRYFGALGGGLAALATEIQQAIPLVKAITWDDFYCYANTAPASGQTVVLTLRKNSASPGGGLVCTITGTANLGVVTGSAVSYAIGDTIDIMGVISATAGTMTNGVMWGGTIR